MVDFSTILDQGVMILMEYAVFIENSCNFIFNSVNFRSKVYTVWAKIEIRNKGFREMRNWNWDLAMRHLCSEYRTASLEQCYTQWMLLKKLAFSWVHCQCHDFTFYNIYICSIYGCRNHIIYIHLTIPKVGLLHMECKPKIGRC
jgi:hypothetical protein